MQPLLRVSTRSTVALCGCESRQGRLLQVRAAYETLSGPNDVSIIDPDAVKLLYGHKSEFLKG